MHKVFIVDDEPFICEMIATLIDWNSYGFQIAGKAYNGQDAWNKIRGVNDIALLITDIQMAPMNGLELMRRMREEGVRTRVIVLSAYDDFHYLKEAMALGIDNYLLKPLKKQELENVLEQIASSIAKKHDLERQDAEKNDFMRTNVLNQIISNNYSIRDVKEKCELLGIRLNEASFQTVILDTIAQQNERPILQERHLCQYAMMNITAEVLKEYEYAHLFGSLSGEVILLLAQSDNYWTSHRLNDVMNRIIHSVERTLRIQIIAIIADRTYSWRTIYQSYHSAKELQDYKYLVEKSTILNYSHENVQKKMELAARQLGLDRILEALKQQNLYPIREHINYALKRLQSSDDRQIDMWRSACVEWFRHCLGLLQSQDVHVVDVQNQFTDTIQQLWLVDSMSKLSDTFRRAINDLIAILETMKLNKSDNMINDIKLYIDTNYKDNLTLKYLSDMFYISSSYLGKRFRQEIGESFNDYVNRIRIHKAKQLLMTTRENASDIAAQIGYSDPNYFYRQFKKYAGCSPTEFRKV